jgi:hypothetical protein
MAVEQGVKLPRGPDRDTSRLHRATPQKNGSFNPGNLSDTAGLGYSVSADRVALTSTNGSIY